MQREEMLRRLRTGESVTVAGQTFLTEEELPDQEGLDRLHGQLNAAEVNRLLSERAEIDRQLSERGAEPVEPEPVLPPPDPITPDSPAYEQTFAQASRQWMVNHNLGHNPMTLFMTSGGAVIDEPEIVHLNGNQFIAYFVVPMSGRVRCV
jgi:hypothetical protein